MVYPERIRQARELCGLTQGQLAALVGVNQSAIAHIEGGRNIPSSDVLTSIATQTGFRPSFFEREPVDGFSLGSLVLRGRAVLTAREQARAYQYAKIMFEQVRIMAEHLNIPPVRLPSVTESPMTAARVTRVAFGLSPDAPIRNLVHSIEKHGILVFALPIALEKLDAFSTWAEVGGERPIIAVSSGKPGDRLRFSIAHELGHLVMHQAIRGRMVVAERQADKFAAEFLLPEKAIEQEIAPPVTLTSIARLKPRWGVSMQALIRRSHELGIITERQYRYLFEQLSCRGWRTNEPGNLDVPVEKPQVIVKMIEQLYGGASIVESYASDMHLTTRRAVEFIGSYAEYRKPATQTYVVSPGQLAHSRN